MLGSIHRSAADNPLSGRPLLTLLLFLSLLLIGCAATLPDFSGQARGQSAQQGSTSNPVIMTDYGRVTQSVLGDLTRFHSLPTRTMVQPRLMMGPDSVLLAMADDGRLEIIDALRVEEIRGRDCNAWCPAAFHPKASPAVIVVENLVLTARALDEAGPAFPLGDGREVTAVAFSGDGEQLALADMLPGDPGSARIRLFRYEDRQKTNSFELERGPVRALAFNHDGRLLASAVENGPVAVWATAGVCLGTSDCFGSQTVATGGAVRQLAFVPTPVAGQSMLMADNGHVWRIGPTVVPGGTLAGGPFAISPDGNLLAVASPAAVTFFDVHNNLAPRGSIPLPVTSGPAPSLAFSPDSRILALGGVQNGAQTFELQLWSVPQLTPYMALTSPSQLATGSSDVAFSAGGKQLFQANDERLIWWTVPSDRPDIACAERPLHTGKGPITRLWAVDGQDVIVAVEDHRAHGDRVVVYYASNGLLDARYVALQPQPYRVQDIAFLPNHTGVQGRDVMAMLVEPAGDDQEIWFWNWHGKDLHQPLDRLGLPGKLGKALAFNGAGTVMQMAMNDGRRRIWDLAWPTLTLREDAAAENAGGVYHTAAFAPDMSTVFVDNAEHRLHVLEEGQMKIMRATSQHAYERVTFSDDSGRTAAITDCQVWLWRVASDGTRTFETILRLPGACLQSVDFHPANPNIVVTTANSGQVHAWELPYPVLSSR